MYYMRISDLTALCSLDLWIIIVAVVAVFPTHLFICGGLPHIHFLFLELRVQFSPTQESRQRTRQRIALWCILRGWHCGF